MANKGILTKVLHRRRKLRLLTVVVGVLVFAMLVQMLVLNNPKSTKAAVMINGNDAVIDGGADNVAFVIDQNGNVYQQPSQKFTDDNGNNIDFRYYAYLSTPVDCAGATCNIKGKNLTIRNSQVLMEGSQSYQNLTVDQNGSISEAAADRDGMINKPLYTGDFWGAKYTGFLKIPANSVYYLTADDVNGAAEIDYSPNASISNNDAANNWTPVYVNSTSDVASDWSNGAKANTTLSDYSNSKQYTFLQNDSNTDDKWVPVRFLYAKGSNPGVFNINYQIFNYYSNGTYFPANNQPYSQGSIGLDRLYGVSDGNPMKDKGQGMMNFEYYVSANGKTLPNTAFGNAIKTVKIDNISLAGSFAGNFGYMAGGNNVFQFSFGGNSGQAASPIGDSIANTDRVLASRHSAFALNPTLFPSDTSKWPAFFKSSDGTTRRIEAGLTLNVNDEVVVNNEKGINMNGVGYPGWGNEFYKANDLPTKTAAQNRGGGIGGGELSDTLGGGGSHARNGGSPLPTFSLTGKTYYDDATEVVDKSALGSGGGSSKFNIGGSGGGAVKVITKKVTANVKDAIVANGNGGMVIDTPNSVAGGAGGKIVIKADEIDLGAGVDTGATKNQIFSTNGFGDYASCSGGSGGYIVLAYNISNDDLLNSKDYSIRLHVTGGNGLDSTGTKVPAQSGQDGIVSVIKKSSIDSVTIKKWLTALDRPVPNTPPNPNFNPYSVQAKDKIRVSIEISQATPGFQTDIADQILKVPNSSEQCTPTDGTILPPNNSSLLNSGYDSTNGKVYWSLIPNTTDPILVSYDCEISN